MKYYYAKIGQGNIYAGSYLSSDNELKQPAIPIYFDSTPKNKEDFLLHGRSNEQGRHFFDCGENNEDKIIIVISKGTVNLLKPTGDINFIQSSIHTDYTGMVKLLPVKTLESFSLADVPAILAGIAANRYYSSGTFREIKTYGNILAIQSLLKCKVENPPVNDIKNALICLSSFEFETLIAKIFEEAGFFVPAYRGGNMQGADLFAHNNTLQDIKISGLCVPAGQRISIQVKLNSTLKTPPAGIDYLIGIDIAASDKCLSTTWLRNSLQSSILSTEWIKQSLSWLPTNYIENCDL